MLASVQSGLNDHAYLMLTVLCPVAAAVAASVTANVCSGENVVAVSAAILGAYAGMVKAWSAEEFVRTHSLTARDICLKSVPQAIGTSVLIGIFTGIVSSGSHYIAEMAIN